MLKRMLNDTPSNDSLFIHNYLYIYEFAPGAKIINNMNHNED